MSSLQVSLILLTTVLILAILLFLLMRMHAKIQESQKEVALAQTSLLQNLLPLLSAQSLEAYQGVMYMQNQSQTSSSLSEDDEDEVSFSLDAMTAKMQAGLELSQEELDAYENAALGAYADGTAYVR